MSEVIHWFARKTGLGRMAVLAVSFLSCGAGDMEAQEIHVPRVLLLYSNDRLLPANLQLDEGLRKALDPQGRQARVAIFYEFLDATRLGGPEQEDLMEHYLRERYRKTPPSVLVAIGIQSLRFFHRRREALFPGLPLIFGGAVREELDAMGDLRDATGLPMEITAGATVESLLTLLPKTRQIWLVHGASAFDRNWRDIALRQCEPFQNRVKITACPEMPLDQLKSYLGSLPEDAAVVYLAYFQSPTGEAYIPLHVVDEIAGASAAPVMGIFDSFMGSGVLGVNAASFEEQGVTVGHLIRRVLSGERPGDIGILPATPPRLVLDARQVKRHRISSVPKGAELRFHTPTLWEQHRAGVVGTAMVLGMQSLLITGLVASRSRQKKAEAELRLSEARFSGIFHGSPIAISIIRQSDGRIVDVNPAWEKVTGMSRAVFIGQTPIEAGLLSGEDIDSRFQLFLESEKSLNHYELFFQRPDGHARWLSLSSGLISLHGEPCYVMAGEDVTERHVAEEAREQLAHASRLAMLGEVTASIAHEVNQPLGAILSNARAAEMLLEQPSPALAELKQILTDIRRDNQRASTVITRVRNLVGRRSIKHGRFGLNRAVQEAGRLVKHEARRRGVALIYELGEDLPMIHGDAGQIEQLMLNLLINAMDAMKDTPVASRQIIIRSAFKEPDSVEVSVTDRGHGIPPDKIGRVFDSFFTTKEDGMGLGLALARSIAEAHGGYISAANNPDTGATFHLILPSSSAHSSASHV